jgi:hypothetical protein
MSPIQTMILTSPKLSFDYIIRSMFPGNTNSTTHSTTDFVVLDRCGTCKLRTDCTVVGDVAFGTHSTVSGLFFNKTDDTCGETSSTWYC